MTASDINHWFGNDLALGPTGDLGKVSGDTLTQQRLVRRLLTALGNYIQQLGYGAGLGAFVGLPSNQGQVAGVILRQCRKEASIQQNPPPVVSITKDAPGNLSATITYIDAATGLQSVAVVPLSGS